MCTCSATIVILIQQYWDVHFGFMLKVTLRLIVGSECIPALLNAGPSLSGSYTIQTEVAM